MSLSKSQLWITGTAVVCVVIVLAGWFALIAPKRAEAAELREQTAGLESSNAQLEASIAQLKAEFAELPQREAELAVIKAALPEETQLAALTRELQAQATANGVTLMTISPGALISMAPSVVAAPAPAEGEAGTDAAAAPAAVPAATSGLSALPVSVQVVGSFAASEAFLRSVQTELDRRFLVDGVAAVSETAAAASAGKPAVANGDVTFTVTGRVFVLSADAAAVPATTPQVAGGSGAPNN